MLRRSLLALLVLAGASCLSPTLPLPPPEEPETVREASEAGTWQVAGTCSPGARVTVLNENTGRGVVFDDRDSAGTYSVTIEADACQVGSIVQEIAGDGESTSASTRFVFRTIQQGVAIDPSECTP